MKKKINMISLHNLRVAELFPFLMAVLPILQLYPTVISPKLKALVSGLAQTMVDMESTSKKGGYQQETKAVNAADANRDNRFASFCRLVESSLLSGIAEEEQAAELILTEVRAKGDIVRLPLKEETAALCELNTLFTSNPRYAEALVAVGAKGRWDAVWAAQQEFEATYGYRNGLMVEEKVDASMYDISKRARRELADVLELLEDCYHVEEKPEYLEMIGRINQEVDKVMPLIRARATAAQKSKDATGTPTAKR